MLINLLILGLSLIAKILIRKGILTTSKQDVKGYKFWLMAIIPVFGYLIFNLPVFFNLMAKLGSKLPVTSLFPFLVCELFIPIVIAFLVNLYFPISNSIFRATMFSIPVFLTHIYSIAQRWYVPLTTIQYQNPYREIILSFITMETQVGIALLLIVIFMSWYTSTVISSPMSKTA